MDEREFWLALRRGMLGMVKELERPSDQPLSRTTLRRGLLTMTDAIRKRYHDAAGPNGPGRHEHEE